MLETVTTKDGGHALKAGENLKTIKNLLENPTRIDYNKIDALEVKDKKKLYQSMHLMMEIPLEGEQEQVTKQSKKIFQ